MAEFQSNTEIRVALKADVAREVDRALEDEANRRDVTKREIVEDALRAYLKLPKRSAA